MTLAYRDVALPVAGIVAAIVLVSATVMEVRHYRQTKALGNIADQMHAAH
jgi:energy-converting hydrogenase Eha subunit B